MKAPKGMMSDFLKEEAKRRAKLTPEELAQEDKDREQGIQEFLKRYPNAKIVPVGTKPPKFAKF